MSSFQIAIDEHLGFVHNRGQWRMFAGYVAEWILDYASYDPSYHQDEWVGTFRSGMLVVTPHDGDRFCDALRAREITPRAATVLFERHPDIQVRILFLVDFDHALFLSKFYDIALEEYVPKGWESQFVDPMESIPDDVKRHFGLIR